MPLRRCAELAHLQASHPRKTDIMTVLETGSSSYSALSRRRSAVLVAATAVLAFVVVLDILVGPAFLAFTDVVAALVLPETQVDPTVHVIVHAIRLPMTLMALLVGALPGNCGRTDADDPG